MIKIHRTPARSTVRQVRTENLPSRIRQWVVGAKPAIQGTPGAPNPVFGEKTPSKPPFQK